jgi:glycosyltransferase involved in cell wall biosynthesis
LKILYISNYLGPEFVNSYCRSKSYSISGTLKSTAIARSLLRSGHEVTICSPGVTVCNKIIKSHTEKVSFPEGELTVEYPIILSFRKCSFLNSLFLTTLIRKRALHKASHVLVYYNISLDAALNLPLFGNKIRILDYEDNIFNKALKANSNRYESVKEVLFKYVIKRTDAAILTGLGMLSKNEVGSKVFIPGAIDEDVLTNISFSQKSLDRGKPIKLLLAGGLHYSKGPDLVIKALSYIQYPCILAFYGSGVLDKDALELISTVPSYHKVIQNGFVQHDELIRIMSNDAHILLNTTRDMGVSQGSAGYPFKMMEYAASGCPIVSSRIGRYDEDFNRLVTFYENEDPEEIGKAIKYVIENYQDCARKSLLLQSRVISEFSIDGISQKLNLFFGEINKANEI